MPTLVPRVTPTPGLHDREFDRLPHRLVQSLRIDRLLHPSWRPAVPKEPFTVLQFSESPHLVMLVHALLRDTPLSCQYIIAD